MDEPCDGTCPRCDADVVYEQLGPVVECPGCGTMLEPQHDCAYDVEADVAWCSDWLEPVEVERG